MNKTLIRSVLLSLLLVFSASALSACLKEGDVVSLTGTLKQELVYGPPNFGENPESDEKLNYLFLYPDKPLDCVVDADTSFPGWGKKLHIEASDEKIASYNSLVNSHVIVKAQLGLANVAEDNTPVILTEVSAVQRADKNNK